MGPTRCSTGAHGSRNRANSCRRVAIEEAASHPIVGLGYGDLGVTFAPRREPGTGYGFRRRPYASQVGFEAEYAAGVDGFRVGISTDHRWESSSVHSGHARPHVHARGHQLLRPRQRHAPGRQVEFFDVRQRQWLLQPAVAFGYARGARCRIGPVLQYVTTDSTPDRFISASQPYGVGGFRPGRPAASPLARRCVIETGTRALACWPNFDRQLLPGRLGRDERVRQGSPPDCTAYRDPAHSDASDPGPPRRGREGLRRLSVPARRPSSAAWARCGRWSRSGTPAMRRSPERPSSGCPWRASRWSSRSTWVSSGSWMPAGCMSTGTRPAGGTRAAGGGFWAGILDPSTAISVAWTTGAGQTGLLIRRGPGVLAIGAADSRRFTFNLESVRMRHSSSLSAIALLLAALACKPAVQLTPPPAGAPAAQVALSGASVLIGAGDIARLRHAGRRGDRRAGGQRAAGRQRGKGPRRGLHPGRQRLPQRVGDATSPSASRRRGVTPPSSS